MSSKLHCLAPACMAERTNAFYCAEHLTEDQQARAPLTERRCGLTACSTRVRGDAPLCDRHLARALNYGLSPQQLEALIGLMDGACYVCQKDQGVAVDHAHDCCDRDGSCGKCVRGWLCERCNWLLGYVRDSKPRLMRLSFQGTLERDVYVRAVLYLHAYEQFRARVDGAPEPNLATDFAVFEAASALVWKGTMLAKMQEPINQLGRDLGVRS